jgi:aspartate beta-hydroxylase
LKTTNILYDHAADLLRRIYSRRLSGPPILDPAAHFPASERFSAAWRPLREEALRIAANLSAVPRFHELMPQQAAISAHDERDWWMFVIKAYGVAIPKNAAQCPILAALASSVPEVLSATLSFLAPRKHIPEHRGPFRGVIRYYLGLSVPLASDGLPGTVLTIDGTEYRIGNGQWLLWDDTFAHEARNDTEEVRIALLLDVRRRGMPFDMEVLSRLLIAAAGTAVRLRKFA